ncbi:MAG: translocation/assembly module TamB domain-containing protein [Pseudomonadota bacterium]
MAGLLPALRSLGLALIGVTLLVVLLLCVLLGTSFGARVSLQLAEQWLPELSVAGVNGALWSPLELSGVRYRDATVDLTVDRLWLRWSPAALASGVLRVDELSLRGSRLQLLGGTAPDADAEATTPPTVPELPLRVDLTQLRVVDFVLLDPAGATTLRVERAATDARWDPQLLALENVSLLLSTRALTLSVDGALALRPDSGRALADAGLTSELRYLVNFSDRNLPALAGTLNTEDRIAALTFRNRLDTPYASLLDGQLMDALAEPRVEATFSAAGFRPAQLDETLPAGAVDVRLLLSGALDAWNAEGSLELRDSDYGDGDLAVRLRGSAVAAEIERLAVTSDAGRLSATGAVGWGEVLSSRLRLELDDLNPEPWVEDLAGRIGLTLALDARWPDTSNGDTLSANLAPLELRGTVNGAPLRGSLAGQVNAGVLRLEPDSRISLGDNRLEISGELAKAAADGLLLDLAFDALEQFGLGVDGQVRGAFTLGGAFDALRLVGQLSVPRLTLPDLSLTGAVLDADLAMRSAHTQALDVTVAQLVSSGTQVDELSLSLAGPVAAHELSVAASVPEADLSLRLTGRLAGVPESGPLDLTALSNRWQQGALRYVAKLAAVDLSPAVGPSWTRESGGTATAGVERLELDTLCLATTARAPARLCVSARQQPQGLELTYRISDLELGQFKALLDPSVGLQGRLGGEGLLTLPADGQALMRGTAQLTLAELQVHALGADPRQPTDLRPVLAAPRWDFALDAEQPATAALTFDAPFEVFDYGAADERLGDPAREPAQLNGRATADLSAPSWDQVTVDGVAAAALDELAFLAALSPELERAGGTLELNAELGGTLGEPELSGALRLRDGRLALATPAVELTELTLTVVPETPADARRLTLDGGFESGGGALSLVGLLDLSTPTPQATLSLTGERVLLANTAEARLLASPDLQIVYGSDAIAVKGALAIPEASIRLNQFPPSAVTSSSDARVVRRDDPAANDGFAQPVSADLRVTLGDAVRFEGFGLTTGFAGTLRVLQRPGQTPIGRGEIALQDGRYQAYGQNLAIEKGRAIWTDSPIGEPGIDLRAFRRPRQGILVGVNARGPLSEPRTSLYSEPSLSESDQLAYLVLGRPLEDSSSSEQSLLSQAALALGIRGGNFLSDRLGGSLGVDDIGIETEAGGGADTASFVVGKYLAPSLYVSYGVGLLDAVSRLKLEYFLSDHWKLVTESSTISSGGDLIYSIDRK